MNKWQCGCIDIFDKFKRVVCIGLSGSNKYFPFWRTLSLSGKAFYICHYRTVVTQ